MTMWANPIASLSRGTARLFASAGLALACLASITLPADDALAQGGRGGGGGGGFMNMFGGGGGMMGGRGTEASYSSRDLDHAADALAFDAAQKEGAKAFYEAYQASFTEEAEKFQKARDKAMEAFQEDRDPAVFQSIQEQGKKLNDVKVRLDKELWENVQGLLTPEQQTKWPKFERGQRREKAGDRGFISGERLDLIAILEKIELASEAKASVTPILDGYEVDLDREIVARGKVQDDLAKDAQEMFGNMRGFRDMQNLDTKKIDALISKGRDASIRVRDVNRRYSKQIEGVLTGEPKDKFLAEVQKQSYPDVYRQSAALRSLDAAVGFGDLSADQKSSIESLRSQYSRDVASINVELAQATEKNELEMTAEKMMNFMGGGQDDPVRVLRTKKREMGDKTVESLKKVLTPEQVERLPAGQENDFGGGRRNRGNDGAAPGARPPRDNGGGGDGNRPPR